ncbi:MAG: hypothetical protein AABW99_02925 [archaeon]
MGLDDIIGQVKAYYFSLEDKYYNFLDKLNEEIPVYKVIDPIDKVVPSFLLFIGILALILVLLLGAFIIGALFNAGGEAKFLVVNESDQPIAGAQLLVMHGQKQDALSTDAFGEASLKIDQLKVQVKASKNGYDDYAQELQIESGKEAKIVLKAAKPALLEKYIEVRDQAGKPLPGASIQFACSQNYPAPSTKTNSGSEERILVGADCGILTATVNLTGYNPNQKALSGTRTVFLMSALSQAKGSIRVLVREASSGKAIPGIDLLLFAEEGNIWKNQSQSDSSGVAVFSIGPGRYYVKARDQSALPVYANLDSEIVDVEADKENEITISLSKLAVGPNGPKQKVVLLKFLDKSTKQPLEGVRVSLYENNALVSTIASLSDGIALFTNVDANNSYAVTAKLQGYVHKFIARVPTVDPNDSNATTVLMEKADPPNNSGKVIVRVKDFAGNPVSGAQVYLYQSTLRFYVESGTTSSSGEIAFENMPFGDYNAGAEKAGASGSSVKGTLAKGPDLILEVTLVLGQGSMVVEVVDTDGRPVQDAKVEFINEIDGTKLAEELSATNGKTKKVDLQENRKPYLLVSKAEYLPTRTISYQIISKKTLAPRVVLHRPGDNVPQLKCDNGNNMCIGLVSVLKGDGSSAATSFKAGSHYILAFTLKVKSDLNSAVAVVRTGKNSEVRGVDSLIRVEDAQSGGYSVVRYNAYDAGNNHAGIEAEITNSVDAKLAVLSFGPLSPGVYNFTAKVFVATNAPDNAELQVRYGAKARLAGQDLFLPSQNNLYLKSFYVNKPLECDPVMVECANFAFDVTLSEKSSPPLYLASPITLDLLVTQELRQDVPYSIHVSIFNQQPQSRDVSDATLTFSNNNGSLELTPASISAVNIQNGTSYTIDPDLKAIKASSSSKLGISLGLNVPDDNITYTFRIPDKNAMNISVVPNHLNAGVAPNLITAGLTNAAGLPIRGAIVQWSLTSSFDSPNPFIEFGNGSYSAQIETMFSAGDKIYVRAKKAFYNDSGIVELSATSAFTADFSPTEFDCLTITPERIETTHNSSGTFSISTSGCEKAVEVALYVPSATQTITCSPPNSPACVSSNSDAGPITLKKGGQSIIVQSQDSASFRLGPTESADILALGDKLVGQYDVYIKARYADSGAEFQDVNMVEVIVSDDQNDLFSIQKTAFNIFSGQEDGNVFNKAHVFIPDFWEPNVSFDLGANGRYSIKQPRFDQYLGTVSVRWTMYAIDTNAGSAQIELDSNLFTFIPSQNEIYVLGVLSGQAMQKLGTFDFNVSGDQASFIQLNIVGDPQGMMDLWWEGTPDTNITIKGRFLGNVSDNGGDIGFSVVNTGFKGRDYALINVEDYVNAKNIPNNPTYTFDYKIHFSGSTEKSLSATIPADGKEQVLGTLQELGVTGSGPFVISEEDTWVVVYFKNRNGGPTPRTNDAGATVYARTAFNLIAATHIDIGIMIDTSGSMEVPWRTVCSRIDELKNQLSSNGFTVNAKVFKMGDGQNGGKSKWWANCNISGDLVWGDKQFGFNGGTDTLSEAWGATAQDAIDRFGNLGSNTRRVLLIIGDNAPSGRDNDADSCSPYSAGDCYWRQGTEELIVKNLIEKANANNISLFFWHPTTMESYVTDLLQNDSPEPGYAWDNSKNDAVEMMEWAAESTGGAVDTYENSSSQVTSNINRFVLLILKASYPVLQQNFHVRIDAGSENICYGPNDIEGVTGEDAVPRILASWDWSNIKIDSCDLLDFNSTTPRFNADFHYCDATQFTTEIMHKLQRLKTDVERNNDFSNSDKLLNFQAFLMPDGYSRDFLSDYNTAMMDSGFFNAGTEFTDPDGFNNLFKNNKIHFSSKTGSVFTPLPAPGLYDVTIALRFGNRGNWKFFPQGQTNFDVNVVLSLRSQLDSGDLLYRLPINSNVGATFGQGGNPTFVNRQGYGTGFSGEFSAIGIYGSGNSGDLRITGSSGTPVANLSLSKETDFTALNATQRGKILTISNDGSPDYTFTYSPSVPTPVLLEIDSNRGVANGFIYVNNSSNRLLPRLGDMENASSWTGIASNLANCADFSGNRVFNDTKDRAYTEYSAANAPGLCGLTYPENAYGFYWPNAPSGSVSLGTMFYTPDSSNYAISLACDNPQRKSSLFSDDLKGVALDTVQLNGLSGLREVKSIGDILELVKQKYVCISASTDGLTGETKTEFWWNQDRIYGDFEKSSQSLFCGLELCSAIPSELNCASGS